MKHLTSTLLAGLAASLFLPLSAHAGGLVIGAGAPDGNCFPFGCGTWNPEYQQVYAASDFSGPITITEISFYDHNNPSNDLNTGNYQISFSTTLAAVDGLDLNNLANNVGGNNTLVYNADLPGLTGGAGGQLRIVLATPFTYDPSQGNLLIDVVSSANNGLTFLDAYNGGANGIFSRALTPGCCSGDAGWGLVTGFNVTGVPEPATWAMMLIGVGAIGGALRRRPALAA